MIILGLTGSIGMGKSTTAKMFAEAGIPVSDADSIVHELYSGRAAPLIEAAFPGTVEAGTVDRTRLSKAVLADKAALQKLEAIVHPLVAEERDKFLNQHRSAGEKLVVLDIPLLFETGGEKLVDKVVVVTADEAIQRQRVLERPGMTEEKFNSILTNQVPDAEKRSRADFIIDTGLGMQSARDAVDEIIAKLSGEDQNNQP
ncbi:MAG: dephospho-CoA kinase [Rhizobiaceae bacterium]